MGGDTMGFVIWYKVEIDDGSSSAGGLLSALAGSLLGASLPVTASNDVLSCQYLVDADIRIDRLSGAYASTFEVKLQNLPKAVTDLLSQKQNEGVKKKPKPAPLQIKIYLDYFDNAPSISAPPAVFQGVITRLKSVVNDEGVMVTTIKGQELIGYALRTKTPIPPLGQNGANTVLAFVQALLKGTGATPGQDFTLASGHGLTEDFKDFTDKARNPLELLGKVADKRQFPVVLCDQQVFLKNAVGKGDPTLTLTEDDDIVSETNQQDVEEAEDLGTLVPAGSTADASQPTGSARPSLQMIVLGNAALRPGQVVAVKYSDNSSLPGAALLSGGNTSSWRVERVRHVFSTTAGFTTELLLLQAKAGELAGVPTGVFGVVQRFKDVAEATQRTPIDVGEIRDYANGDGQKHLATLNYGQSPKPADVAPSVATPVDDSAQLFNKPIASPFAFHKCGLIVPVYPKMRALLAHNLGLTNDAVVAGFLWSENPRLEPPANHDGDYWLCLPTALTDGLPSGKGVNDLTDSAGERVIQAKGIKIFVGSDKLPDVGKRPDVPSGLDGTIVVEHEKGATITITSDGAITIQTTNQDITLTTGSDVSLTLGGNSKEISLTNGKVTLKMSDSSVDVS